MSKRVEDGKRWLILYCEDDESFSLVDDTEAVYDDETLSVGNRVNFFFKGQKYEGIVKDMGVGDDEYDRLNEKLVALNATNKRKQPSFHADQKRRGRGANMKGALASLKPKQRLTSPAANAAPSCPSKKSQRSHSQSSSSQPASASRTHDDQSRKSNKQSSPLKQVKNVSQNRGSLKAVQKQTIKPNTNNQSKEDDMFENIHDGNNACKSSGGSGPLRKLMTSVPSNSSDSSEEQENSIDDSPPSSPTESNKSKQKETGKGRHADLKALKQMTSHNKKSDKCTEGASTNDNISSVGVPSLIESGDPPIESGDGQVSNNNDSLLEVDSDMERETERALGINSDNHEEGLGKGIKRVSIFGGSFHNNDCASTAEDETVYVDSDDDEKTDTSGPKAKRGKKSNESEKTSLIVGPADFQMLRFPKRDSAKDLVKVKGSSAALRDKCFYMSNETNKQAKLQDNATKFAKTLLYGAFSDEALYRCSLKGGVYRAAGKGNFTQKPALDQDIVALIVDVTELRQSKKQWSPKFSTREILAAMRQKIQDLRPSLKKKFADL